MADPKCKADRNHVRCVKDSGGTSTVHLPGETIALYIPHQRCRNHPDYNEWVILMCDPKHRDRGMHLMPLLAEQMSLMLRDAAKLGDVDIDHKESKSWTTWRTITNLAAIDLANLIDIAIDRKGAP